MKGVISQKHLILNERLAKESNNLAKNFSNKNYSKIENIDTILLKRDVSVGKKKNILLKKLHESIAAAFSIDKKRFGKEAFMSLRKRLRSIRRLIIKLRSINYYLETTFLEGLKPLKIRIRGKDSRLKRQNNLAKDELEALEYSTFKLIGKVIMLDKRLLGKYTIKERRIAEKEKVEVKELSSVLRKESQLLEHLEAKLPPPRAASLSLIKEPVFTNWAARVFALLSCLEYFYAKEAAIFSKLRKNKSASKKISKKIIHIIKEKSKLLKIMEEKANSMGNFKITEGFKKELRSFTTAILL